VPDENMSDKEKSALEQRLPLWRELPPVCLY
jgi:hypothetical protein